MKRLIRTGIELGVLLAVVYALFALSQVSEAPVEEVESPRSEKLFRGCVPTVGQTMAFALHSEVSSPSATEGADVFSAVLSLRALREEEGGVRLRAGWSSVELRQAISLPDDRLTQPVNDRAFEMTLQPDCRIRSLYFSPDWSPQARLLAASSLGMHEYVLEDGLSWEVEQTDGVGRHRARYHRSGSTLKRQKLFYADQGLETFGVKLTLSGSEATARFGRYGLESSLVQERLRIELRGQPASELVQQSSLVRHDELFIEPASRQEALTTYDPSFDHEGRGDVLPEAPSTASARAARFDGLTGRMGGWTVRDARAMAGLLSADPMLVAELADLLLDPALEGGERASVFWALELAGTPEAKVQLTVLMDAPLAHDRIRAAAALSQAGEASPEDLRVLYGLHEQDEDPMVRSAALLAFGAAASGAPADVQQQVGAQLSADLLAAESTADRRMVLEAIGNTQDAALLDVAAAHLDAPSVELRVAAASALRGMGPGAAAPLKRAFEDESSGKVALAMARSLFELGPAQDADLSWIEARLDQSESSALRARLIEWAGSSSSPAARRMLAARFDVEPSARLRRLIGRFVPGSELGL
ncbi:MAG: hypothetical protein AAGD10_14330 [Myxococcota bacterium]